MVSAMKLADARGSESDFDTDTELMTEARNAGVTISDFFTRATSVALQAVPEGM